jgi:hypothetical protein
LWTAMLHRSRVPENLVHRNSRQGRNGRQTEEWRNEIDG